MFKRIQILLFVIFISQNINALPDTECSFPLFSKTIHHQVIRRDVFLNNNPDTMALRNSWQNELRVRLLPWVQRPVAVLDSILLLNINDLNFNPSLKFPSSGIYLEEKVSFTTPQSSPFVAVKKYPIFHNSIHDVDELVLVRLEGENLKAENIVEIQRADQHLVDYRKDDLLVMSGDQVGAYIRFYDGSPTMRMRSGNDVFHALFYDARAKNPWEHIFAARKLDLSKVEADKSSDPLNRHIEIGRLYVSKEQGPQPQTFLSQTWQHKVLDRTFEEENTIQEFTYGPKQVKPKIYYYANTDSGMAKYLMRDFNFKIYLAARKKKTTSAPGATEWELFEVSNPKKLDPDADYVLKASAPEILKAIELKLKDHKKLSAHDQRELEEQLKYIKVFLEHNTY